MPYIQELLVDNFRNCHNFSIDPIPPVNVIVGPNGAGKTSVLESLSVLAHGKSFRTHKYRSVIREGQSHFTVFGRLFDESEMSIPIGVERHRSGEHRIRIENRSVSSSADLASRLPLLVVNSTSFELLNGGPKDRRRFFDWLVFHVKHDFFALWKRVIKCIKQRNTLLRSGNTQYDQYLPWDREIARLSSEIDRYRQECCEDLETQLNKLISGRLVAFSTGEIGLDYLSGWKDSADVADYASQLESQFDKDLKRGYTTLGPHKADLRISSGSFLAQEVLSRGQQKMVIVSLYVAKAQVLINRFPDRRPVFCIDDMPSELDENSQKSLATWLDSLGCQTFLTSISDGFIEKTWNQLNSNIKVFHVKHGEIDQTHHLT